jgi:hypothetical protein
LNVYRTFYLGLNLKEPFLLHVLNARKKLNGLFVYVPNFYFCGEGGGGRMKIMTLYLDALWLKG